MARSVRWVLVLVGVGVCLSWRTFDVQWDEEGEPFTYGLPRECLRFPKDSPRKSPRKSRNRLERSAG